MKKYEIEIGSTTYRTYYVSADSQEEAEEIALREVGLDFEIPKEWAENAEVTCINGEEK
jgi:predicted nucleotidyltransferase